MKRCITIIGTLFLLAAAAGPATAQQAPIDEAKTVEDEETSPDEAEPTPEEQQQAQFDEHLATAKKHFAEGDHIGSIAWLKRAYEVKEEPEVLYNIGRIYEQIGKFDQSIEHYKRFVSAPGVDQSLREDAVARIKTIKEVQMLNDDEPAASTSGGANPGLTAAAPPPAKPNYTVAWITIPAGVALLGTGVALTLMSGAKNAEAEQALHDAEHITDAEEQHHAEDHAKELEKTAKTLGIASIPAFALGGISTMIGVIVAVSPPKRSVAMRTPKRGTEFAVSFRLQF